MESEGFHGDSWQPEQETKRRSRKEDDNLEDEEEVGMVMVMGMGMEECYVDVHDCVGLICQSGLYMVVYKGQSAGCS